MVIIKTRDPTNDGWIKEFMKRKLSSRLFWAVWPAEKKKYQLPSIIMQLFGGGFFNF